jgi:nicotinamide-nucleotide amidase
VNVFTEEYRQWRVPSGPFYKAPDEARFVTRLRDLLVREQGAELWLTAGTPRRRPCARNPTLERRDPKRETNGALHIEIINTGSELMLGRVLNSHQQWLCRQLADRGYLVRRQVAVGDCAREIQQALREALPRADLVITTGGLGPTSDDLTREAVTEWLGRTLEEDRAIWEHITAWFAARNRPMPASTRKQALVPSGATVLPNQHGAAPGLLLEAGTGATGRRAFRLLMLPGPPRELRPMFTEQVVPWLAAHYPRRTPYLCRTLRTTGIGESMVQERIAGALRQLAQSGLDIGYCARPGEVDVRLASDRAAAPAIVAEATTIVRHLLGPYVYGEEEEPLEAVIVRLLAERGQTVVVAESCTGGRLANRITDVPGASVVFRGGVVGYSNELKQLLLGVSPETLAAHGAVSEPVAREMAEGARARLGADYALALTGIAGPTGGTPTKPAGTVFIALAAVHHVEVARHSNTYDRDTFKHVSSQQALEMLRRALLAERVAAPSARSSSQAQAANPSP